jgi:hypothetical protein
MTRSIVLSLLNQANTGEQLLQILDTIVEDANSNDFVDLNDQPTLNEVAF